MCSTVCRAITYLQTSLQIRLMRMAGCGTTCAKGMCCHCCHVQLLPLTFSHTGLAGTIIVSVEHLLSINNPGVRGQVKQTRDAGAVSPKVCNCPFTLGGRAPADFAAAPKVLVEGGSNRTAVLALCKGERLLLAVACPSRHIQPSHCVHCWPCIMGRGYHRRNRSRSRSRSRSRTRSRTRDSRARRNADRDKRR